jgi:Domain of unknown function (DUF6265)
MVMQRTANPSIRVRFPAVPPQFYLRSHDPRQKPIVGRLHHIALAVMLALGCALTCGVNANATSAHESTSPSNVQMTDLAPFAWLSGVWKTQDGSMAIEEQWTEATGDAMLGLGRTMRGVRVVAFEFLRLSAESGRVVYWAMPQGRPATAFALTAFATLPGVGTTGQTSHACAGTGRAVFTNPDHDFPQTIIYEREGDKLHVRLEGRGKDGALKVAHWRFSRDRC